MLTAKERERRADEVIEKRAYRRIYENMSRIEAVAPKNDPEGFEQIEDCLDREEFMLQIRHGEE